MKERRVGNDFFAVVEIVDNGNPVDLISVKDTVKIKCKAGLALFDVNLFEVLSDGKIKFEIDSNIYNKLGIYRFYIEYSHFDMSMSDNNRKRTIDKVLFELVPLSEHSDNNEDLFTSIDATIGFEGKNAYQVWLEDNEGTLDDYFAFLRQPATDTAADFKELMSHPTKIIDNYWHEYNVETREYVNTNIKSKGDTTTISAEIDSRGHLIIKTQ